MEMEAPFDGLLPPLITLLAKTRNGESFIRFFLLRLSLITLFRVSESRLRKQVIWNAFFAPGRGGGGRVLPYIGHKGMCGAKGYSHLAVLV